MPRHRGMTNSDATEHSTMVSDRADESQVVSRACAVKPQSRVCKEEQTVTLWLLMGRGQPEAEALHGGQWGPRQLEGILGSDSWLP